MHNLIIFFVFNKYNLIDFKTIITTFYFKILNYVPTWTGSEKFF